MCVCALIEIDIMNPKCVYCVLRLVVYNELIRNSVKALPDLVCVKNVYDLSLETSFVCVNNKG